LHAWRQRKLIGAAKPRHHDDAAPAGALGERGEKVPVVARDAAEAAKGIAHQRQYVHFVGWRLKPRPTGRPNGAPTGISGSSVAAPAANAAIGRHVAAIH